MLRIASILRDFYPRPPQPIHASLLGSFRAWYPGLNKVFPHPVVSPNVQTLFERGGTRYHTGYPPKKKPDHPLAIGTLPRAD